MNTQAKCGETIARPHEMDEILEIIWTEREQDRDSIQQLCHCTPIAEPKRWLQALQEAGLVHIDNDRVTLSVSGEYEAEQIIRRHRLAERLFGDVFATSEAVWEREACELEHQTVLIEEAVSAVCAFLGHPPTCPHGRPIPRGRCCAQFKKENPPFVIPLNQARIGMHYRIVFMTPAKTSRLDRLAVLGILPGGEIRIQQKLPSYVIRAGETDVAFDRALAGEIYVRPA